MHVFQETKSKPTTFMVVAQIRQSLKYKSQVVTEIKLSNQ